MKYSELTTKKKSFIYLYPLPYLNCDSKNIHRVIRLALKKIDECAKCGSVNVYFTKKEKICRRCGHRIALFKLVKVKPNDT